ncbi:MAG: hypothetical protein ABSG37_03770 [Candidatus Limnocylindrales bacterium]
MDTSRQRGAEDELNEQFNTLLRDAANEREGRARAQSKEDAIAASEESAALLALARTGAGKSGRARRGGGN